MSRRIVLILAAVFAIALIAAVFLWGRSMLANRALAGQSKILVVAGNRNGNLDTAQSGPQAAQQLIPVTGLQSPSSRAAASPYLVVAGQSVDDHYAVSASTDLTVVGTYHDR